MVLVSQQVTEGERYVPLMTVMRPGMPINLTVAFAVHSLSLATAPFFVIVKPPSPRRYVLNFLCQSKVQFSRSITGG